MAKRYWLISILICLSVVLFSCGGNSVPETEATTEAGSEDELIVVGFSQLGAESDYRSENTNSMINTFTEERGYRLIFENGQQSQINQITAIRRFIQQDVDYIVLAPVTEDGWDTVLSEARDAGIPVIIIDRMVNVSDDSLYTCWVGSDFELEAYKVTEWLKEYCLANDIAPESLHIANIQGTMGASAEIGRTSGLEAAADKYGWDIVAKESGEFTQNKGREVMSRMLRENGNINVVYCENDNSAFGAIEAIKQSGKKVGSDIKNGEIMVLSFDGVNHEALSDVLIDEISCIGGCNPLHGAKVENIIETLEAGGTPEKKLYIDEKIYSASEQVKTITVNDTEYEVTILDEDNIEDNYIENQMKLLN